MVGVYRALLIGNSTYPADEHNLPTLKGPAKDIVALHSAITDRYTGLFEEHDVTVLPEVDSAKAIKALDKFFSEASREDVLLVYFSGHGKLDQSTRLHLCMKDTDSTQLLSTAVCSTRINEFALDSRASNIVIVLDCCHSGAFRGGELVDALDGPGRYVLTSCRQTQLANDATEENGTSLFTQYLVDGLVRAVTDQDGDGYVTFSDLYKYLHGRMSEDKKQMPQWRVAGDGDVRLARRPQPTPADGTATIHPRQSKGSPVGGPPSVRHAVAGDHRGDATPDDGRPRPIRTWQKMLIATVAVTVAGPITALYSFPHAPRPGWPYNTGSAVYTKASIHEGTIYLGSTNGHIYALNADTGTIRWEYPKAGRPAIGSIYSNPLVARNMVYVGSDDGRIYALKDNGVLAWARLCNKPGDRVRSSPALVDGVVYATSGNGYVCARRATSGTRYWNPVWIGPGAPGSSPTVGSPAPKQGLNHISIYVGSGNGHVYALNAGTGAIRWKFPLNGQPGIGIIDSQPTMSEGRSSVYAASSGGGGHLYALAAGTGRVQWEYPPRNQPGIGAVDCRPAVAVDGSAVYIASQSDIYALDPSDGTPLLKWKHNPIQLPSAAAGLALGPAAIYVGSGEHVYCLNYNSGVPCWSPPFAADSRVVSTPAVNSNNGIIYFGTLDGRVYALTAFGRLVHPR